MTNHMDLATLTLKSGKHGSIDDGACLLEAVSYFAHEPWSDHPECVSPLLAEFGRSWNDAMDDTDRQILVPLIPRLVGTRSTKAVELKRSWMALDWYCRVSTPAWLRLAGLNDEAAAIEATAPIVDTATAKAPQSALDRARKASAAAGAAAWDVARAAAGAALRPTVVALQASALDLMIRMIEVTE